MSFAALVRWVVLRSQATVCLPGSKRYNGVARALVKEIVRRAREEGYGGMMLDTIAKMQAAVKLHVSEGFEETSPYTFNPLDGVMYFSKCMK